MKLIVRIDSREKYVKIIEVDGCYKINIDGREKIVDCRNFGHKDYFSLLIDHKSYLIESAAINENEGKYYASVMGRHYDLEVLNELLLAAMKARGTAEVSGDYVVAAPMPGLIIDIKVSEGDHVAAGSSVVIMEAMKMQNALISEVEGIVKEVYVSPNDSVESQAPLVLVEKK